MEYLPGAAPGQVQGRETAGLLGWQDAHSPRMHEVLEAVRGRPHPVRLHLRGSAIRPLRPGAGGGRDAARASRSQAPDAVALRGGAAAPGRVAAGLARGRLHATTRGAAAGRGAGVAAADGEGRGGEPDRVLQGAGAVGGRVDGAGTRRPGRLSAVGRERWQRPGGLRCGRRPEGTRVPPEGHRVAVRAGGGRVRRRGADRRRADHGRGAGVRSRREGAGLVRVRDAERALPRRGEEDHGVRDRGADGVDASRRDPVSHGRRDRAGRHVESLRGARGDGLHRPGASPDVRRAGRGLRADREGLRRRARGRTPLGERLDPRPRAAGAEGARRLPDPSSRARERRRRGGGQRGGDRPRRAGRRVQPGPVHGPRRRSVRRRRPEAARGGAAEGARSRRAVQHRHRLQVRREHGAALVW